jgi:hypothetical protein
MSKTNMLTENHQTVLNLQSTTTDEQKFNPTIIDTFSNTDNSLHGEMSKIIQNFNKISIKEIVTATLINEKISSEKNLGKIVNDIINYIFKIANEGKNSKLSKYILDHLIIII